MYSLIFQKMIENCDLSQLNEIFLKRDMDLYCADKRLETYICSTCSHDVLNKSPKRDLLQLKKIYDENGLEAFRAKSVETD